jgi:hypothetical protein
MEGGAEPKRAVQRSPNYPAFSLEEAVKKIKILWEKDGKVGADKDIVLKHLGYSAKSGPALRALSTLKKFDLIAEKEDRVVLSQRALDLVVFSRSDERHLRALREAALKPQIYQELHSKFGESLPSDDTLKAELIRRYNFNPKMVNGLLTDFRRTIEFAGLLRPEGKKQEDYAENHREAGSAESIAPSGMQRESGITGKGHAFPIPLMKQNKALISFERLPVTEEDLERLKQWIDLMKVPLIESDVPPS